MIMVLEVFVCIAGPNRKAVKIFDVNSWQSNAFNSVFCSRRFSTQEDEESAILEQGFERLIPIDEHGNCWIAHDYFEKYYNFYFDNKK